MFRTRFAAVLAVIALPLLLSGCTMRLHILIPDFSAKGVDGLRLYRVGTGGRLAAAGYITFDRIILTAQGLQMQYTQFTPENTAWGPLMVPVEVPSPGQVALEMSLLNSGAPGYFRFASFNEHGTSKLALGQIYAAGG